jgi:hypothetical protein
MSPTRHSAPRAGIDPIDGAGRALAMLRVLVEHPLRFETIALLLDDRRRGLGALVVDGTHRPDAVLDVAHLLAGAAPHHRELRGVVLASVRPGCHPAAADDVDRWADVDDILDTVGVELVEWFVVSAGEPPVSCPRDLLGAPPRW